MGTRSKSSKSKPCRSARRHDRIGFGKYGRAALLFEPNTFKKNLILFQLQDRQAAKNRTLWDQRKKTQASVLTMWKCATEDVRCPPCSRLPLSGQGPGTCVQHVKLTKTKYQSSAEETYYIYIYQLLFNYHYYYLFIYYSYHVLNI